MNRIPLSDIWRIDVDTRGGARALLAEVKGTEIRLLRYSHSVAEDVADLVEAWLNLIGPKASMIDMEPIEEA